MRIIYLIGLVLLSGTTSAQQKNWKEANNWKLYNIHTNKAFGYTPDTLSNFRSVSLGDSLVQGYLIYSSAWPKEKDASWMGVFIASYEDSNKICKVDISVYGGFLFDESIKQYFELPLYMRNDWMEFLNNAFKRMPLK